MSDNVKRAPNPFDKNDIILGCPRCKSVESMAQLCDEDGCRQIATCGMPVNDKREYVRVCGDHYQRIIWNSIVESKKKRKHNGFRPKQM